MTAGSGFLTVPHSQSGVPFAGSGGRGVGSGGTQGWALLEAGGGTDVAGGAGPL
jgi:hypothetical protein